MTKLYRLHYSERDDDPAGVAYFPGERPRGLFKPSGVRMLKWKPVRLELRDGAYADRLASNECFRVFSAKLRAIVEEGRGPRDVLQWLPVTVVDGSGEERPYFCLHFPVDFPEIVDYGNCTYYKGDIIKHVYSAKGLEGHNVVTPPNCYGIDLCVSPQIRRMILDARCTNVSFSKAPVTQQDT